jgi:hypothetical protein
MAQAGDTLLELHLEKTRVWPRQPVDVTVTFLVSQTQVRDVEYPGLDGTGFQRGAFAPPVEKTLVREGREYRAQEFTATLIPEQAGIRMVGPAEIGFLRLAEARGAQAFFGASEPQPERIQSAPVRLEVLPLPARGRPAEFAGAVGRYRLSRSIREAGPAPDGAVTVTTRYQGPDARRWFACPEVQLPGVRAYPPQIRQERDSLVCRQVLLAEADATLPALRIAYFDPKRARYVTEESPAIPLRAAAIAEPPPLAAPRPSKPAASTRTASLSPWWLLFLLPLPVLGLWRRRGRAHRNTRYDLKPLQQALDDIPAFHAEAHRLAQALAAAKLGRPAAGLTAADMPEEEILAKVLRACDAVRYGGAPSSHENRVRLLESLTDLARPRRDRFSPSTPQARQAPSEVINQQE